ncbi:MAG: glycosyltransferase family 4 protein [Deferrisomatales bacterium]|nr:glycosyltransferase family 4 protein [Deferrisomatales bacterium]
MPQAGSHRNHGVQRVLSFGVYSKRPEYPRHLNLLAGLRERGVEVLECHETLAERFGQRLQTVTGAGGALRFGAGLLLTYPRLARRFPRRDAVDAVLVGYPGIFHVHLARLLRDRFQPGAALVLDVFAPLYDTLVHDRRLLSETGLPARLLRFWERRACGAPDALVIDTATHANHLASTCRLPREKIFPVWVGPTFPPARDPVVAATARNDLRVVFVGTYIPLHGIEVILDAARRLRGVAEVRFALVVGSGQLGKRLEARCREWDLGNVRLREWVDAGELRDLYRNHDIGLGIFGDTEKASRVIPIKVFDLCAAGLPVITSDTPAIREAFRQGENACLVPPADPEALARAILKLRDQPQLRTALAQGAYRTGGEDFSERRIGEQALQAIRAGRSTRASR